MKKINCTGSRRWRSFQRCLIIFFLVTFFEGICQGVQITGQVLEFRDRSGLEGIPVRIEGEEGIALTDESGNFRLLTKARGVHKLLISAPGYLTHTYPLLIGSNEVNLGPLFLKRDLELEKYDNLGTLTEAELVDEAVSESNSGLLQATRDIFLNRAAFDFGQAFFRVRGYDSREGMVLINGIPLNRIWDGRPQWNNWGGLNDATRNQEFRYGLEASDQTFGRLMGTTSIDLSPLKARPGLRISSAASNRTYRQRLMATYHSGPGKKGFAYSLALSRRWAEEGYVSGTPYDAYSTFASVSYSVTPEHSLGLSFINAYNSRGRSAALTDEVAGLLGPRYNPYWGWQDGALRTSRIRTIHEPLLMFNYEYAKNELRLRAAFAHQSGGVGYTRIGYYDAPNPDPTYYRYLPSYYNNSPIGANFIGANEARSSLLQRPQLQWKELYEANTSDARNGNAAYACYADRNEERVFTSSIVLNLPIGKVGMVDAGTTIRNSEIRSFARIRDLMGAGYLRDSDPFSDTRNDLQGKTDKGRGETFGYHFKINTKEWNSFLQTRFFWGQWDFYVAGEYAEKSFRRDGLFLNERFPENSFGEGRTEKFDLWGLKSGLTCGISSRHWISAHAYLGKRPPLLKQIYINPRENHSTVQGPSGEIISSMDLNYLIRLPMVKGRISGYYTRFRQGAEVNFFYVDSGFGSDFVQEVVTDIDRLFKGFEIGLDYQIFPSTKASLAASIGRYEYANNPVLSINFDAAGAGGDLRQTEGNLDLGPVLIKGYKQARGPQTALSLGLEYRDPSYWWIGATANYLADNYADIAYIRRTESFKIDPETGSPFPEITEGKLSDILLQHKLPPVYLLNLVGGKSWIYKGKYISAFLSVSNLFDTAFKSGGYEQSRNGNYGQEYRDNLGGTPSFGPKYWYGFGRTFFMNLAISI